MDIQKLETHFEYNQLKLQTYVRLRLLKNHVGINIEHKLQKYKILSSRDKNYTCQLFVVLLCKLIKNLIE